MDIQISGTALFSFVLFLAVLVVVFRKTRQEAAIAWILRMFFCVGFVVACFQFGSWNFSAYAWWAIVYTLLAALFVFGVFSSLEASLTIRIFTEIAQSRGIGQGELMKRYNKSFVVRRRIERLLYSGELVATNGRYMRGRASYFALREVFLNLFRKLFPR